MDIGIILIKIIALFMALTFHEFAHGWIAGKLGDRTAESQGRLTLNPKDHIDPFGTILVPVMLIFMKSPVVFGWAKPVPINPLNFRNQLNFLDFVFICCQALDFFNNFHLEAILSAGITNNISAKAGLD